MTENGTQATETNGAPTMNRLAIRSFERVYLRFSLVEKVVKPCDRFISERRLPDLLTRDPPAIGTSPVDSLIWGNPI